MFEYAPRAESEPCNKYGGCPHGGTVPKNTVKWFCDECMIDLSVKRIIVETKEDDQGTQA